ncbi:hypothetical protein CFter6_2885 [Collimonas fungivorans]|uniref:Uncharacterized protein n=1 Tax=Collimonas fungivorans TaxID=158899 RepID=A0A127PDN0_9BURK|nr:hypothetical protein CFter6_2885 [Collimonas fungivorans]
MDSVGGFFPKLDIGLEGPLLADCTHSASIQKAAIRGFIPRDNILA